METANFGETFLMGQNCHIEKGKTPIDQLASFPKVVRNWAARKVLAIV
jgi:hypothetical protein